MDKCTTIYYRGAKQIFYLQNEVFNSSDVMIGLRNHILESLFSEKQLEHRVKKANDAHYPLQRNISLKKNETRSLQIGNSSSTSLLLLMRCAHKTQI